ncbi:MAG: cytochrome c biogenesis protein ResB [Opitutaceae bacterium]|nr:cytochrome c biogenesis protein ResB [Opitutaceae bacterium]
MRPLSSILRFFTSLQLTVGLIALSIVLVLVATLDQVNLGLLAVQEKYFRTFVVLGRLPNTDIAVPMFPGGYLLGGLLLVNLVTSHIYRFRFSWKNSGLMLTHAGLIVLLVGELLTGLWQRESLLQLREGATRRYSEDFNHNELAFINTSSPQHDVVVSVPETLVADRGAIEHPQLPFKLRVIDYMKNAALQTREQSPHAPATVATAGVGPRIAVQRLKPSYKSDERNVPAAFIELSGATGPLGTWLVSTALEQPQQFTHDGQTWKVALRSKRYYAPYSVTLLKVTHDVYPGSEIPKNFASRVRVRSDDGHDDREVVIFMNNPLRYQGQTYYQHQMNKAEGFTGLQVVRNPSWALPYIASIMLGGGLAVQFAFHLLAFVRRRHNATSLVLAT